MTIFVDKQIMDGTPHISGTRIPVYVILEKLEYSYSLEDVLKAYPDLTLEQVKAAIRYARDVLEVYTHFVIGRELELAE